MTLLGLFGARPPSDAAACAACRHFTRGPRALEAALPGLAVLSSGHASTCADDGLCERHARFTSARSTCAAFAATSVDDDA